MAVSEELQAITPEDENPLDQIGDEADAPEDVGRGPDAQDQEPPEATSSDEPAAEEIAPQPLDEDTPSLAGLSWRNAVSIAALRDEVNARWPHRDKRSDGTIGDEHHCPKGQASSSDHCPNPAGVVRAFDIDVDGIPAAWLAEHLRTLGASGDKRLANGGYVIFNRRIASWSHEWLWRAYTGEDPHTSHIHISVSQDASGYDAAGTWNVGTAKTTGGGEATTNLPAHAPGSRLLKLTDPVIRGTDVAFVQRWVGAGHDGAYGSDTKKAVQRFQRKVHLDPDGRVGKDTWRAMRVT
jgi:putative peptidoglycan binding protein